MQNLPNEIWFITGSQHLYGPETLKQVAQNSEALVRGLNDSGKIPLKIIFKPVVTTPDAITALCLEANGNKNCIGLMAWMHTFSPAKMWIAGLSALRKPFCQLHTQFNAEIPWSEIDMDFMNLNQSAHGDREFGFMLTRMRRDRKVIVGHWQDTRVQEKIGQWSRVCLAATELRNLKVARFGDNMREVAVTEGDKVAAQLQFGFSVNGFDSSDIVNHMPSAADSAVIQLVQEYEALYQIAPRLMKDGAQRQSLTEAAQIELGMRGFLTDGGFMAFTDTFENLGQLKQLPGLAVQRLMADGYGFGGEGDWKTAALVRTLKVMSRGLPGGTSFMEDYTYHFSPNKSLVLGAHMLEICPSIAAGKPSCEIHPLGIGNRKDPVRLVFDATAGPAVNVSLIDLGNRFRMILNEVEAIPAPNQLPKLPVARAFWDPKPNLETSAEAWLLAGGAHHTAYSQAINTSYLEDFADIFGIELLIIDGQTQIREFKNQMRSNEVYYQFLKPGH